jgi:hypothetical protein
VVSSFLSRPPPDPTPPIYIHTGYIGGTVDVFLGTVFYQRASRWRRRRAGWRIRRRWASDGEVGFNFNCVYAASVRCIVVFVSGRAALLAWFWYAKGDEDGIYMTLVSNG